MNDSYTDYQRRQHDADGGFAAALASGHEKAATVLRNLPDNSLMAVATTQYVFAVTGYYDDRKAAVDAWAAAHHVTAGWVDGTGYCARLECGPLAVVVIAAGVDAFPAPGQDAPVLAAVAA